MILDIISTLGGLIVSPLYDFIKKKFLPPSHDTPEATMSSLAVTHPEVVGQFAQGYADLIKAKKDYFNRDVIGTPSPWVADVRAIIRPIVVIAGVGIMVWSILFNIHLSPGIQAFLDINISSWFGCRLTK